MLIDCPSCARSYPLNRAALGESGRMVVCPRCTARWFVGVPDAPAAAPAETETKTKTEGKTKTERKAPSAKIRARASNRVQAAPAPPRQRPASNSARPAFAALVVAGLILPMGLIAKRTAIVQAAPRTAALYAALGLPVNLRGLAIGDVKTATFGDAGRGLEIAGTIHNVEKTGIAIPKLTFEIRDAQGATLSHWSEAAPRHRLAANESVAFITQAPVLPDGSKDVIVRFETPERTAPPELLLARNPHPPG